MRSRTYPISLRARARQPGGEVVQRRLEAPGEALGDAALLLLPRLGVAAQAHLQAVLGQFPDQPHRAARLRPDGHRLGRVERPLRLPADHQVAVAFPPQPGQPVLRRHAAVHHHQGAVRRAQRPQHLRQRAALGDVAGEHPRAADEAARVQRQPQRQQRTVAAFSFECPRAAFGIAAAPPSKNVFVKSYSVTARLPVRRQLGELIGAATCRLWWMRATAAVPRCRFPPSGNAARQRRQVGDSTCRRWRA